MLCCCGGPGGGHGPGGGFLHGDWLLERTGTRFHWVSPPMGALRAPVVEVLACRRTPGLYPLKLSRNTRHPVPTATSRRGGPVWLSEQARDCIENSRARAIQRGGRRPAPDARRRDGPEDLGQKGSMGARPKAKRRAPRGTRRRSGPQPPRDQTRHWSRPCTRMSRGSSMPMNTMRLLRASSALHSGPRSLPMSWCTPWKITLRSVPFMFSTPL